MNLQKPTIYFPIEIKPREFLSKILLTSFAIKAGFRVYIGSKTSITRLIRAKKHKGGIFFFKGGKNIESLIDIKKKCDHFVILDQEMGTETKNYGKVIKERIWPGTERLIDRYYVIGKHGYKVSCNIFSEMKNSIRCSGWPRVDMWRKENNFLFKKEAEAISKKHGNFILFSSDFGSNSNKIIDETIEIIKKTTWKRIQNDFEKIKKRLYADFKEYNKFLEILKKYDEIEGLPQIIIRPHPAEDIGAWFDFSKKLSNIKIIYEGEISPWINASSALLHRGCTSAIQAHMQGLPIAYYVTDKSSIVEQTPYNISKKLLTFDELVQFCKTSIDKSKTINSPTFNDAFKEMIHIDNKKFASELIVEDLVTLETSKELSYQVDFKLKIRILLSDIKYWIKNVLKIKDKIESVSSAEIKMEGISKKEVGDFLSRIENNSNFKLKEVLKNCIEIEK
jgi:surface carbohydrate biosynthesis protein